MSCEDRHLPSIWEVLKEVPPWGSKPRPRMPRPALPPAALTVGDEQESIHRCAEVLCDNGERRFATLLARAPARTPDGRPGWAYLVRYHAGTLWGDTHAWGLYIP